MSSPIGRREASSALPVTSATGAPPSSAWRASAQRAARGREVGRRAGARQHDERQPRVDELESGPCSAPPWSRAPARAPARRPRRGTDRRRRGRRARGRGITLRSPVVSSGGRTEIAGGRTEIAAGSMSPESSIATASPSLGRPSGDFDSIRWTSSSSASGTSSRSHLSDGGSSISTLTSTASPRAPRNGARPEMHL